jgi:peptidase C39-like protein
MPLVARVPRQAIARTAPTAERKFLAAVCRNRFPRRLPDVSTDLFVAARGIDPRSLLDRIPPGCRRSVDQPAITDITDGEAVITAPDWTPRAAPVQLLPSLSVLSDADVGVRLEIAARIGGDWTPWIGTVALGGARFSDIPDSYAGIACDVDVFAVTAPVEAVRTRARLGGAGVARALQAPWMLSLSAWSGSVDRGATAGPGARVSVPPRSQVIDGGAAALHICSPTSVAMVLDYWDERVGTLALAAEIYQPALDRYGVWPAAIRAAGHHGVAGYLLRFSDWSSAAWCLERSMPIVASVRYTAGELSGAPLAETTGHLLVVTGYDGDTALVNDPVAPTPATVCRRYRLDDLTRVWLDRTGVGYILFKP